VTSLEPRTLHQPGKLRKLSKNDYLFTLSSSAVNQNRATLSILFFNGVQAVHKRVTDFGADSTAELASGAKLFVEFALSMTWRVFAAHTPHNS